MGYENEHPDIQESKLEEKYRRIPNFNSPEFSDSNKLLEWFSGYNEYYSSKYSISLVPENSGERCSKEFYRSSTDSRQEIFAIPAKKT
jgi:hypothetical protein